MSCNDNNEKITIDEIAKQAGVSIATVSRIINNKGTVRESTKRKVYHVMEQVNFIPKANDTLSYQSSNTLLVCIPDYSNPFNASVFDGVQESALEHGYNVLILEVKDFSTCEEILKNHAIAGIVVLTSPSNSDLISNLEFRCPTVMCSQNSENVGISSVTINNTDSARKAVDYLIFSGRKKIAMMNSSLHYSYAKQREDGFRNALESAGIPVKESWIFHLSAVNYHLAMSNALHLLSQPERPDAVFAVSDVYAVGVVKAAKRLGLRVPEDVAVIGFDNIELSSMIEPTLTTIEQPSYQIGYQAAELLIEKIENPNLETRHIVLDTELIVRDSTPRGQY